jgi:hypothetical protein
MRSAWLRALRVIALTAEIVDCSSRSPRFELRKLRGLLYADIIRHIDPSAASRLAAR